MKLYSAKSKRRTQAKECFKTASDCIGTVVPGMALFAITRGQFSMLDAIQACLEQVGPAKISLWTWTIADYEIECFTALQKSKKVVDATLVIDHGARNKNHELISKWQDQFGPDSVRYVCNHAKIATIETSKFKLLLRGSMNLNFNPRFEQFDITEGGADFDLIKEVENELPILPNNCSGKDVYKASRLGDAFESEQLDMFKGLKVWK